MRRQSGGRERRLRARLSMKIINQNLTTLLSCECYLKASRVDRLMKKVTSHVDGWSVGKNIFHSCWIEFSMTRERIFIFPERNWNKVENETRWEKLEFPPTRRWILIVICSVLSLISTCQDAEQCKVVYKKSLSLVQVLLAWKIIPRPERKVS